MNRPYQVLGSAPKEAERFIITVLSDRAELFWEYSQYGAPKIVSGTQVLAADYFATNTMKDFVQFREEQPWGNIFSCDVIRDDRFGTLFSQN